MTNLHTVNSTAHIHHYIMLYMIGYIIFSDGLHTTVCSFDIRKCFDTINHSILCKKMENNMVVMKMTLTCSGIICLIENKMTYLKCVISILVFRKDLS